MRGGTLIVSRAKNLLSSYKKNLETVYGFKNVTCTSAEKDGLNMAINEIKPKLLMMDSDFYLAGTPYMIGALLKKFPKLNIAIISMHDYPISHAVWFIWHGAKSFVRLWDGEDEFKKGIEAVRDGKGYISPCIKVLIESFQEWPDTRCKVTKRQMECLNMLCCGLVPERIGDVLHITRKTVNNHLDRLYDTFHVSSRGEMIALAWSMGLITKLDLRFYDGKTADLKLPEWAVAKKEIEKRILRQRGQGERYDHL